MRNITVAVDLEFDGYSISKQEVIFNVQKALDIYFNQTGFDYDEEVLRVIDIHENVTVVSPWDKRTS